MKTENYQDFLQRVNSYHPHILFNTQRCFVPDEERVVKKVNHDGTFRSFYGDAVVFKINQHEQQQVKLIAKELYKNFTDCFAEQVKSETYHVTLHDLVSSNELTQIAVGMFKNELAIKDAFRGDNFPHNPIKMRSAYLLNMVNTSIVLVLIPSTEADYKALIQLKRIFQEISPLDYPLTPHITLAYFSRAGFDQNKAAELSTFAAKLYNKPKHFSLQIDDLFYQKFISMNHYYDIFRILEE